MQNQIESSKWIHREHRDTKKTAYLHIRGMKVDQQKVANQDPCWHPNTKSKETQDRTNKSHL